MNYKEFTSTAGKKVARMGGSKKKLLLFVYTFVIRSSNQQ